MTKILAVLILAAFLLPTEVDSASPVDVVEVVDVVEEDLVQDEKPVCVCECSCSDRKKPIRSFLKNRKVLKAVGKYFGAKR